MTSKKIMIKKIMMILQPDILPFIISLLSPATFPLIIITVGSGDIIGNSFQISTIQILLLKFVCIILFQINYVLSLLNLPTFTFAILILIYNKILT